jgi:hypothetical protein
LNAIRALCLLLLLFAAGCSKPQDAPIAAPDNQSKPAFWAISDNGGEPQAWLFGTIHVLPPDTDWQSNELDSTIRSSDFLVLEASGLEDEQATAKIFTNLGVSRSSPPLTSRIDPALRPKLDSVIAKGKVSAHVLDYMDSWAAALMLASSMSAGLGLESDEGVEQFLTRRYTADNKPIVGLETITSQLSIFDQLPESEQRAMLNAVLRESSNNRERFESMFAAWRDGRVDDLRQGDNEGILASPLLRERLLDGRNRQWTEQIAVMLKNQSRPLIAVGAAHLPGKQGIVALLQAKGYKLNRVQ